MLKFLFEVEPLTNHFCFDFQFELLQSLKSNYSVSSSNHIYDFIDSNIYLSKYKEYIPIGSVEFVKNHMKYFYNIDLTPINVPEELFPFSGREIHNFSLNELKEFLTIDNFEREWFVKSNSIIKKEPSFLIINEDYQLFFEKNKDESELFQVSRYLDESTTGAQLVSEWRVFVHNNRMVGCKNYSSDDAVPAIPDVQIIKNMINSYHSRSPVYTLDIGVINDLTSKETSTIIVEVHDFYSCGLYGFSSPILPYMYSQWFYSYKETRNFINGHTD